MIEWVYEIDLDHEVFLIDTNPLFALNNMPSSQDSFVEYIGVDAYGHRSYDASTPKEHIYRWKSVPPVVDDNVIVDYAARQPNAERSEMSITELLGVSTPLGHSEATRAALYEIVINKMMSAWRVGHHVRFLEAAPDRSHIPPELLPVGVSMVKAAIGPMLLTKKDKPSSKQGSTSASLEAKFRSEFLWPSPNICLRITTHLDDERNFKKSTLEVVDEIILNREPGRDAFGIIFSFFHCVVIHVEANNDFKSTAALQFLPSFYATSPSTPGITAIARLAYHCLTTRKPPDVVVTPLPPTHFLSHVPLDILEQIGEYLGQFELRSLCSVLPLFATALLRCPYIEDYRLVDVVWEPSKKLGNKAEILNCKAFSAVHRGAYVPELVVGRAGYGKGSIRFTVSIPHGEILRDMTCGESTTPLLQHADSSSPV
ncbi:hypothetical protein C8R43DRAFT_644209 [Mycena crocata]|nr:hypothetical protein C8R43DRAFT_644209 [Mycena crocata]